MLGEVLTGQAVHCFRTVTIIGHWCVVLRHCSISSSIERVLISLPSSTPSSAPPFSILCLVIHITSQLIASHITSRRHLPPSAPTYNHYPPPPHHRNPTTLSLGSKTTTPPNGTETKDDAPPIEYEHTSPVKVPTCTTKSCPKATSPAGVSVRTTFGGLKTAASLVEG